MEQQKARVLLADDHDLVRESLRLLLVAFGQADATLARDVDEAMELMRSSEPFDLILMDYWMPGMNGTEGLTSVIDEAKGAPVAVLSGNISKDLAAEVLRLGARGVIPKSITGKTFVNAMKFIMAGEVFVPVGLQKSFGTSTTDPGFGLTGQEVRVLSHLTLGLTNKEIAKEMSLSDVTVKMHVRSILKKLGATNRTQAALIARHSGGF